MNKNICQESVYQELYEAHATNLRNFIYYKCGDLDKAEDTVHEAFIKLWEHCKTVLFEKAKSYLFTCANRLFLNQVAHEKVKLTFVKSAGPRYDNEDPVFQLELKEFQAKLEGAIGDLPEGQREVFLMSRIDKMSYAEIAEQLGLSVKAIEKRMHAALTKLRSAVVELQSNKI